jgi:hypothetical protein
MNGIILIFLTKPLGVQTTSEYHQKSLRTLSGQINMEKQNVIIFAINFNAIEQFLFPWLDNGYSKDIQLHIVSNEIDFIKSNSKVDKRIHFYDYFGPRFNYYDKFIYGLSIINKLRKPAYIWDVDELQNLEMSMHLYDTSINIPQFSRRWFRDATLMHERNAGFSYLTYLCKDIKINPNDVPTIQEDKSWFPFLDYTQFLSIFQESKFRSYLHEGKQWSKWMVDGQGEGAGLGIALTKTKIPYRFVGEYII